MAQLILAVETQNPTRNIDSPHLAGGFEPTQWKNISQIGSPSRGKK